MSGHLICELLGELLEIIDFEEQVDIEIKTSNIVPIDILKTILAFAKKFDPNYIDVEKYTLLGDTLEQILETASLFIEKCYSSTVIFKYIDHKFRPYQRLKIPTVI